MGNIVDYPCPAGREPGIHEAGDLLSDFSFPEAYKKGEDMARMSGAVRSFYKAPFCTLPFCSTVEGEAMGGIVEYGNEFSGPRVKKYMCSTAGEVLQLPPIDFQKGRICEVLKACRILYQQGEIAVLKTAGPFTILNVLADAAIVLKWIYKEPHQMIQIFDKIRKELTRYIQKACRAGVRIISYADPVGGLDMIGPKKTEWVTETFTVPFLKQAMKVLPEDGLIHLCPKTAFALTGTGKAKWIKQETEQRGSSYAEDCIRLAGSSKLAGQACINDRTCIVKDTVSTIRLVE